MKQITLDTSGRVVTELSEAFETYYEWGDLTPFAQGYVTALFESEGEELRTASRALCLAESGLTVDDDESPESAAAFESLYPIGFADLAPETLTRIIADCEAMERHLRRERMSTGGARSWELRQSGFWPKTWPPLTVALDDNGKVVFS